MPEKLPICKSADALIKKLEENGFTVKPTKYCLENGRFRRKTDWNVSSNEHGVKIEISQGHREDLIEMKVRCRTNDNRYLVTHKADAGTDHWPKGTFGTIRKLNKSTRGSGYSSTDHYPDFDEFFKAFMEIRGDEVTNVVKEKADLNEPIRFKTDNYTIEPGHGVVSNSVILPRS